MEVDASVAFKGLKGSIGSSGHGVATPRCDSFGCPMVSLKLDTGALSLSFSPLRVRAGDFSVVQGPFLAMKG